MAAVHKKMKAATYGRNSQSTAGGQREIGLRAGIRRRSGHRGRLLIDRSTAGRTGWRGGGWRRIDRLGRRSRKSRAGRKLIIGLTAHGRSAWRSRRRRERIDANAGRGDSGGGMGAATQILGPREQLFLGHYALR